MLNNKRSAKKLGEELGVTGSVKSEFAERASPKSSPGPVKVQRVPEDCTTNEDRDCLGQTCEQAERAVVGAINGMEYAQVPSNVRPMGPKERRGRGRQEAHRGEGTLVQATSTLLQDKKARSAPIERCLI